MVLGLAVFRRFVYVIEALKTSEREQVKSCKMLAARVARQVNNMTKL